MAEHVFGRYGLSYEYKHVSDGKWYTRTVWSKTPEQRDKAFEAVKKLKPGRIHKGYRNFKKIN